MHLYSHFMINTLKSFTKSLGMGDKSVDILVVVVAAIVVISLMSFGIVLGLNSTKSAVNVNL